MIDVISKKHGWLKLGSRFAMLSHFDKISKKFHSLEEAFTLNKFSNKSTPTDILSDPVPIYK